LRRDATHLQVGTNPAVVIHDRPGLYPLLLCLDGSSDLDALRRHARRAIPELDVDVAVALAPLVESGAVVDTHEPRRPTMRLDIVHDGPSTSLAQCLSGLLDTLGATVGPEADLVIVLSSGEPNRAALDDAVQCRAAHLVVVQDADSVRIGPLVIPGRTPCLNCADLHRAAWDPGWSALLPQFGRTVRSAVTELTRHAAVAEIAAACLEFAEAGPAFNGRDVVAVLPNRTVRVVGTPAFHPRCACSLLCAG
jgi:hypothetical protein